LNKIAQKINCVIVLIIAISFKTKKMKRTTLLAIAACLLFAKHSMHSQETISTAGGKATGSGGSSTYTIGQLVYTTQTESNGSISQGVQQAYEFQTLSNQELTIVNLKASMYPNPTSNHVTVRISDSALKDFKYTLFDLGGKTITNRVIRTVKTKVDMHHLAIGIYLLKISKKQQVLKTFRIIKK
jgi:hypothetical protein